jgi:hypothetical protein
MVIKSNEMLTRDVEKLLAEITEIRRLIGCPRQLEALKPKPATPAKDPTLCGKTKEEWLAAHNDGVRLRNEALKKRTEEKKMFKEKLDEATQTRP